MEEKFWWRRQKHTCPGMLKFLLSWGTGRKNGGDHTLSRMFPAQETKTPKLNPDCEANKKYIKELKEEKGDAWVERRGDSKDKSVKKEEEGRKKLKKKVISLYTDKAGKSSESEAERNINIGMPKKVSKSISSDIYAGVGSGDRKESDVKDEPDDTRSLEDVQKAQEPPNPGVGGGLQRDKLPDVLHPPQVGAGDLEPEKISVEA